MEKDLDYIAEYLAVELSDTNLYDMNNVKVKIKSALRILIDDNVKTEVTEKLRKKTNSHIFVTKRYKVELNFWKNVARSFVDNENEMKVFYDNIDSELISKGFR